MKKHISYIVIVLCALGLWSSSVSADAINATDFVTTWKTDNLGSSCSSCIRIPTAGAGYSYDVDWNNDGTFDEFGITGTKEYNFGTPGTYTIRIRGSFPRIYFNNRGDKEKIIDIKQRGSIEWTSMSRSFFGCKNIDVTATDTPDLTNVTDMSLMFYDASSLSGNTSFNTRNTSNVTNMNSLFMGAQNFDQPLNDRNTSKVTNMNQLFYGALSFNHPVNNRNTSRVTSMRSMFQGASRFNKPLNSRDTSNVTNMHRMFLRASAFNQPLNNRNTSSVTDMSLMFYYALSFNQPLRTDGDKWNVSNVTSMDRMFMGAASFDSDITNRNTSKVTTMLSLFYGAAKFNQPIGNRNTSQVTDMRSMFQGASLFNQNINSWDTYKVTSMARMFLYASEFNHPLSNRDTINVTDMYAMFYGAKEFNQPLVRSGNKRNTTNVANMGAMFYRAKEFNQSLGSRYVGNVSNMSNMLGYSGLSTNNYYETIKGFGARSPRNGVTLGAYPIKYPCGKEEERQALISKGWIIGDHAECAELEQDKKNAIRIKDINVNALTNHFTPINFIGPGNDFAGGFIWLPNKKLASPVAVSVDISCNSQIRGLYFNGQRGERLWPLDQESATDYGLESSVLSMEGGWYTDCEYTNGEDKSFIEYSIFGSIEHTNRGNAYYLVAGVDMDYVSNRLGSAWVNSFQYVNNRTPLGYMYDSVGGIGFVGGRVGQDSYDSVIGEETRNQHSDLLNKIASSQNESINKHVSQNASNAVSIFGGQVVGSYRSDAGLNTRLGVGIVGNVGVAQGYEKSKKRTVFGNSTETTVIDDVGGLSVANRFNKARKNAQMLCRGATKKRNSDFYIAGKSVFCVDVGVDIDMVIQNGETMMRRTGASPTDMVSVDGSVIVVRGADVYLYGTHNTKSFDLFVDRGVLYIQGNGIDHISEDGFAANSVTSTTQGILYKANMIIHGLVLGQDRYSYIAHKLYVHGRLFSLNTIANERSQRKDHIASLGILGNDGLDAHYRMDSIESLPSTDTHHGDIQIVDGVHPESKAFQFDGDGDYITVGERFNTGNEFSVSMWIKPDSGNQSAYIVGEGVPGSRHWRVGILSRGQNHQIKFAYGRPGFLQSRRNNEVRATYTPNEWQLFTFTANTQNNKLCIYKNGVEIECKILNNVDAMGDISGNVQIGRYGNYSYYRGAIDDMRIYNKTLNLGDAQALYNNRTQERGSIERSQIFAWRCNIKSGKGSDGVSCGDPRDQFALVPFVVIDQPYSSLLLTE